MLIKEELLAVPVLPYKNLNDKRYSRYAEFAQEIDLPRSGHIIAADYYEIKTKALAARVYYDGKNVISCVGGEWRNTKPGAAISLYYGQDVVSAPEAKTMVQKLRRQSWGPDCLIQIFDDIVSDKYQAKRERAWKREQELFETLTAMLPDYPKNLPAYCEKHVYGFTYIFVGKIDHGKRTAVCQHCGHEFIVDGSAKPHQHGKCPHCGEAAEYFANWAHPPKEKQRRICICCRAHGDLIIRWVKIKRRFYGENTEYNFEDYYRNFYIDDWKSQTLYAYHWVDNMGYSNWIRLQNGTENTEATYIYRANLRQVFGRNMYGVDLAKELSNCKNEISITRILDSLKNIPQTKYFLHMGMRRLAQDLYDPPLAMPNSYTGRTFAEVLGIRAQYLPLYQKYDVSMSEHMVIKACGDAWVDEEMFLKMREMKVREYEIAYNGFLKTVATIKKSINYLYKQFKRYERTQTFAQLNNYWHDYLQMSDMLNVDISNKQIKFPKDLIEAHDVLAVRTAAIKDKIRLEKVKQAFQTIYTGIPQYRTAKYQIVFPQGEADFIREGQQLHHCVGCGTYFKRHVEGVCMIFFIRKADEPDKPYFTTEVNVEKRTIVQLYGDHDCRAPKEIWNFVEQFCKRIESRGTDAQEGRKLTA